MALIKKLLVLAADIECHHHPHRQSITSIRTPLHPTIDFDTTEVFRRLIAMEVDARVGETATEAEHRRKLWRDDEKRDPVHQL
jgi:hypothetical protein